MAFGRAIADRARYRLSKNDGVDSPFGGQSNRFLYLRGMVLAKQARGKDGIQWRTVDLLYKLMSDLSIDGSFRHRCLLMLLSVSDEAQTVYREKDDWILKTESDVTSLDKSKGGFADAVCLRNEPEISFSTVVSGDASTKKGFKFKMK